MTRDQLLRWASTAGADLEMPRLIRRLIAETTPSVELIDMPAGTGVAASGWDGIVRCPEGNRFVPTGLSVWELSTQRRDTHRKTCDDYDKRVRETSRSERANLAYVAAVCAPWTKARKFHSERSERDGFRLVRALNVDHIEEWLECAPGTTIWLREQLGEPVEGVGLLSAWWRRWLSETRIPLDADIVLAGRGGHAQQLQARLEQQHGGIVTIGGGLHRDEILAFVAAALVVDNCAGPPCDGVLYVDSPPAAQRLLASAAIAESNQPTPKMSGLTVVAPSVDFTPLLPPGTAHRLVVPLPGSSAADIVVDPLDTSEVADSLRAAGEDFFEAHDLGALARMSLLTLRRRLALKPELHKPRWAAGPVDITLRRCILLNNWNQPSEGDRGIVQRYVGCSPEDATEVLQRVAHENEPPMLLTDERWHVIAPADAWLLIADQLTRGDIGALADLAVEVLTEPDPLRGLSQVERLAAQLNGLTAKYSPDLRRGVATTLALLGSFPPRLRGDAERAVNAARGIVAGILRAANDDPAPATWASVTRELSLLAEAAPDEVLAGLRSCLAKPHRFASEMFADGQDDGFGFPSDSPHPGVLDALEVLAWSAEHFEQTVDVLADLSALDPGGRLSNRPSESLRAILCPWRPQTSASADARLGVLDMLQRRHSADAWDLMLSMLPRGSSPVFDRRGPLYRRWKPAEPVVTYEEYDQVISEVGSRLVDAAGTDPERLAALIERIGNLPACARGELLSALTAIADEPNEDLRRAVWPVVRRIVAFHREHPDTDWALVESEIALFDELLDQLRPAAPLDAHAWLFAGDAVRLEGTSPLDYDEYSEVLAARQADAVTAILHADGFAAVIEFATAVAQPHQVGAALARVDSDWDDEMLATMRDAPDGIIRAALGYFDHRFRDFGWEGIDRLIAKDSLSAQTKADLLRAVPPVKTPWRRANELGGDVASQYWTRVEYWSLGAPSDLSDLLAVSQGLRSARRVDLAAFVLSLRSRGRVPDPRFAEEAATCLEQLVAQQDPQNPRPHEQPIYDLLGLLDALDQNREHLAAGRVAMIEWQYYPALRHDVEFEASNLYRHMAQDPEFVVSLVEFAFKPASAPPEDRPALSDSDLQRMKNAFSVLHSWPSSGISPGLKDDGHVDEEQLDIWIHHVRRRSAEIDRTNIGDQVIGKSLAASPPDPDGEWPSRAVRDLLERLTLIVHENVFGGGLVLVGVFGVGVGCRWGCLVRGWGLLGCCFGFVVGVGAREVGPPDGLWWRL